jgi:hypothetical protein
MYIVKLPGVHRIHGVCDLVDECEGCVQIQSKCYPLSVVGNRLVPYRVSGAKNGLPSKTSGGPTTPPRE